MPGRNSKRSKKKQLSLLDFKKAEILPGVFGQWLILRASGVAKPLLGYGASYISSSFL